MMLVFVFAMIFFQPMNSWMTHDQHEWNECHEHMCAEDQFDCKCRRDVHTGEKECIDIAWLCDGIPDCRDEEDETDCICSKDEYQCNNCIRGEECDDEIPYHQCINMSKVKDGKQDCFNGNDEPQRCLPCDGEINCPWLIPNDEANCTNCTSELPLRCDCNQNGNFSCEIDPSIGGRSTCFNKNSTCDGEIDCTDGSDEKTCHLCKKDEFECECVKNGTCETHLGCISKVSIQQSGFRQCPYERRTPVSSSGSKISIHRLSNILECDEIGFPQCDNSTCYSSTLVACHENVCSSSTSSSLICTSFCSKHKYCQQKTAFQCADKISFIFLDQFCDGVEDCADGSDEIVNKPGFKCKACVLPQNNLYDSFAQCDDESDLCLFANSASCFQCLDKRLLISSKQVCDGVNDCFDLSDECLCEENIDAEICVSLFEGYSSWLKVETSNYEQSRLKIHIHSIQFGKKVITCPTKFGFSQALPCDGRPECSDYSDECLCNNSPAFCNDSCHSFFPMGDRYCDGVVDPAWVYFKHSSCLRGFDEQSCPKRFKCNATGNVSIDVLQVCDGKPDCNDDSDETNCSVESDETVFSSDTEMIDNHAIKVACWTMSFIVLFGNVYVILNAVTFFKKREFSNFERFQRAIILNISIADFIMGVYLIIIAAYSAHFSGIYGFVDLEWRSSINCSIIGSLSVISSEASCFFMVILTAFRLINVCYPQRSLFSSSFMFWKISLAAAWLLSLFLGIIPILDTSSYFVHSIAFSSRFHQNGSISVAQLKQFMRRYAALSNATVKDGGNDLETIEIFLKNYLPESEPVKRFGYYGETSVCMPRFYVARGEPSWEYTIFLITANFLCFLFIAIGYVALIRHAMKSPSVGSAHNNNAHDQQAAKFQNRIARIIATDFCCWIPICIMTYVRLGVDFSNIAYQISAAFLLPINSALNPFLFSKLPDKLINLCCSTRLGSDQNSRAQTTTLKLLSKSASMSSISKI